MQKKNPKTRCEKRMITKSDEVIRAYSKIQSAYVDRLEQDEDILEVRCNILIDTDIGEYTTDFLCKKTDGTYKVRECVERKNIMSPIR